MLERKGTLFLRHTQIVIHWTDGRQETVRLGDVIRIGRGKNGNDIPVPEVFQSVSRRHMEIRREHDGYRLLDLGSRNGVLINGVYVKDTYLRDGDEIRIGQDDQGNDIRIEFQLGSEEFLSELKMEDNATISPAAGLAGESPLHVPHFKVRWPNGRTHYFPLLKDRIIIGRGPEADLRVPETLRFVSGQHVEVLKKDSAFLIRDLNSTNGTLLNNQLLPPGQFYPLVHEAIIRFGDDVYGISIGFTFINPAAQATAMDGFLQAATAKDVATIKHILVGRLPTCDLVLEHPEVSRRHALIRKIADKYFIEDLHSSNGTLVNDQPVKQAELHDGDLIQISTYLLLFQNGQLIPYQSSGMRLDVTALSRDVKTKNGPKRLLDNVNLTVLPREFVALVGRERSVLLHALLGLDRGPGQIQLNGHELHRELAQLRPRLGYVSQAETLHTSLTVESALDYTAQLRLPVHLTAEERWSRIDEVLEAVSLQTPSLRTTRISNLSNEQRQRLRLAAELLADPKLIYLDEVTSGFDPGLEKKMMYVLRRVADEGRTILLATQATSNIVQADQIAFLSEGKLVYFGPPEDILRFFDVEDFADIYECTGNKADEWRRVFQEKKPELHKKYVLDRQKSVASSPKHKLLESNSGILEYFRQLVVLSQRGLSVLVSQPARLFLLLALFPLTAILQLILAKPGILTGDLTLLADPVAAAKTMVQSYTPLLPAQTFIFWMALEAFLAGLLLPASDLLKERLIFVRERMANLKVLPYLLSKFLVYGGFAVIQTLLYLMILSFGVQFPRVGLYFSGYAELFIDLLLTVITGLSLGLLISAASRSNEVGLYILTGIFLFQVLFSGVAVDLRGNKLEPLSSFSPTRWSVTAVGVTIDLKKVAASTILCQDLPENSLDPNNAGKTTCVNTPDAANDLPLDYANEQLPRAWSVLVGMSIFFLAVTGFVLRRRNFDLLVKSPT